LFYDKPVAAVNSLIMDVKNIDSIPETFMKLTGNGYFTTHNPDGNFGILPCVYGNKHLLQRLKENNIRNVGRKLVNRVLDMLYERGLGALTYTPLGNYKTFKSNMSIPVEEYINYKINGKLADRNLQLHRNNKDAPEGGAKTVRLIKNARPYHEESEGWVTLNLYFLPKSGRI